MSIIATCGHKLEDHDGLFGMGWHIQIADYDWHGRSAAVGMHVCSACREGYRAAGVLLEPGQVEKYLTGESLCKV